MIDKRTAWGATGLRGQVLTDNASTFSAVPAFVTAHQALLDSISLIDSLAMSKGTDTTGIARAKNEFARQMKMYALRVAGALKALASVQGDQALKSAAHVTESSFERARDDETDDLAQGVYDQAHSYANPLNDYGVDSNTMSAFQTRIDSYRLSIPGPSKARASKRSFTELLDVELRRADMICKDRLDGLMEQFRFQPDGVTERAFYIAYHAAREIIDTGHKKKTAPATPAPPVPPTP